MVEGGHNSDAVLTTLGLAGHVCSLRTDSSRLDGNCQRVFSASWMRSTGAARSNYAADRRPQKRLAIIATFPSFAAETNSFTPTMDAKAQYGSI